MTNTVEMRRISHALAMASHTAEMYLRDEGYTQVEDELNDAVQEIIRAYTPGYNAESDPEYPEEYDDNDQPTHDALRYQRENTATVKVNWISVMGGPEVDIDVTFDFDRERVLVDAETLMVMATTWMQSGIVPDADAVASAAGILAVKPDSAGRYDVTMVGGGWAHWIDDRLDPETVPDEAQGAAVRAHAKVQCTSDDPSNHQGDTCPVHETEPSTLAAAFDAVNEALRTNEARERTGTCWLWENGYATRDDNDTLAGYMDSGSEQAHECAKLRLNSPCAFHTRYTDHNGEPTDDPRCEMGLCFGCINSELDTNPSGEAYTFHPALAVADEFYTDQSYRTRVIEAYAALGVTLREDETGEPDVTDFDPGPEVDDEGGMSEYRHAWTPEQDPIG